MKKTIKIDVKEPVIHLSTEIVYGHRVAWAGVDYRQLKVSLIRPRTYFDYDDTGKRPLLVFLAGGGFTEMDRNAWIPDLVWYARRGYVVASIDYSVTARTEFPMQIEDIKAAIRYLRAHKEEFRIDDSKIVIMGESAGGYLAGLAALSNGNGEYDTGDWQGYSSDVSAAVCIYPAIGMRASEHAPRLDTLAQPDSPPIMILQGLDDSLVDPKVHGEVLYDALEAKGARVEYYLVEGANHADHHFYQDEMKEIVLEFMNSI